MNVDWFEPFECGVYCMGVIYLTIPNLSCHERYRPENIILFGIIPGTTEPKKTINSFLMPLVLNIKEAWLHGTNVFDQYKNSLCVKLALACDT